MFRAAACAGRRGGAGAAPPRLPPAWASTSRIRSDNSGRARGLRARRPFPPRAASSRRRTVRTLTPAGLGARTHIRRRVHGKPSRRPGPGRARVGAGPRRAGPARTRPHSPDTARLPPPDNDVLGLRTTATSSSTATGSAHRRRRTANVRQPHGRRAGEHHHHLRRPRGTPLTGGAPGPRSVVQRFPAYTERGRGTGPLAAHPSPADHDTAPRLGPLGRSVTLR